MGNINIEHTYLVSMKTEDNVVVTQEYGINMLYKPL
jgi:hypothetical protein